MSEKNGYCFPKRITLPAAALTVLLGLMLVPPAAPAKTIVRTHSTWLRGPIGQTRTVTVICPRGTEAISGGYRLTNHIDISGPASSALLPYSSRRAGKRRWKVSVYKAGLGKEPERLTALADCRRPAERLRVGVARSTLLVSSFNDADIAPVAVGTVTAPCPTGTRPLAGGFRISVDGASTLVDGPPPAVVFGSRAVGSGWELTAARLRPGPMRLKSFAYCGTERVLRRSRTVRRKGDGRVHRVESPACPRKTSLLSGGFLARLVTVKNKSGGTSSGGTFPVGSSLKRSGGWAVTGFSQGDFPSPLTSYAYCSVNRPR